MVWYYVTLPPPRSPPRHAPPTPPPTIPPAPSLGNAALKGQAETPSHCQQVSGMTRWPVPSYRKALRAFGSHQAQQPQPHKNTKPCFDFKNLFVSALQSCETKGGPSCKRGGFLLWAQTRACLNLPCRKFISITSICHFTEWPLQALSLQGWATSKWQLHGRHQASSNACGFLLW